MIGEFVSGARKYWHRAGNRRLETSGETTQQVEDLSQNYSPLSTGSTPTGLLLPPLMINRILSNVSFALRKSFKIFKNLMKVANKKWDRACSLLFSIARALLEVLIKTFF